MGAIDEQGFEVIFDRHGAAVFAYLLRRTERPAAEDALSETFLVAWRRRDQLPAEPLPWLYAVARNVLLNQRRVEGRRAALLQRLQRDRTSSSREGFADDPDVAGGPPTGRAADADSPVLMALRTLPAADREVVLLDAWEQLSSTQAGEVLGCSADAYRARLSRAKTRLRRAVEQLPPPGGAGALPTPSAEANR